MTNLESLRNGWTEIPVGTRVQKIGRVEGALRSWFGVVVKFIEPTERGVEVEWGPGLTSWENAAELFLATSSPVASPKTVDEVRIDGSVEVFRNSADEFVVTLQTQDECIPAILDRHYAEALHAALVAALEGEAK